jgi:putative hydrolase of the HAD superfamily
MDDTILAYSQNADLSWQRVCSDFEERLRTQDFKMVLAAIKVSSTHYWSDPERHRIGRLDLNAVRQQIVTEALQQIGIENDPSLAREMALAYAVQREIVIEPFPGAIDTLRELRKRNIRLALLTNGNVEAQRRRIERHQLAQFFDYILIEGEFGFGKPDERVYLHALKQIDALPEEAWMVGDNLEWEVATPQRLGIFAVWLDFADRGLPENNLIHPDLIIRALPDLLRCELMHI